MEKEIRWAPESPQGEETYLPGPDGSIIAKIDGEVHLINDCATPHVDGE